jgi:hypothetical protein
MEDALKQSPKTGLNFGQTLQFAKEGKKYNAQVGMVKECMHI